MIDSINQCKYRIETFNALELSNILKSNYKDLGIDYTQYIVEKYRSSKPTVTPKEIYEYQNFFLLEKDGKYVLLDGFRRLLWYDVPNIDVQVRIYNYNDMTDSQILQLLFNLNHQKLYQTGNNNFFDRGFALFLLTVYGIDLFAFKNSFLGYLNQTKTEKNYSSDLLEDEKSNQLITERITNSFFINDMKFLRDCKDLLEINETSWGALIAFYRGQTDKPFSIDIIKDIQFNALIVKQIQKFNNARDSRNIGYWNSLTPMLTNILDKHILGSTEVKITMVERMDKYKTLLATFKKDKSFEHLGGVLRTDDHKVLVQKYVGKPIQCVVIIEPKTIEDEIVQPVNLYYLKRKGQMSDEEVYNVRFGIKDDSGNYIKKVIEVETNSSSFNRYVKKTFGKYPTKNENGYDVYTICDVFIKSL